jgi:hypothetical protein
MLTVLVALLALPPALALAFLARRAVGHALRWRRRPGWRRLTCHAAMERFADVDAAGHRIVFEALPEHRFEVRARDLATGRERVLSDPDADARHPRLSADGRVAAWQRLDARTPTRRSRLVTCEVDGGAPEAVDVPFEHVLAVALDGSGRRLLVSGAAGGVRRVVLIERGRGPARDVLPGPAEALAPCLTADGLAAAVLTNWRHHPLRRFEPCVLSTGGSPPRVFEQARDCRGLAASSDGAWLAFEAVGGGPSTVVLLDAAHGRQAVVGPGFAPVLSPDGRWLAFDEIDDAFDLVVVDLRSSRRAVVSRGNPYPHQPRLTARASVILCAGHLNPLSRTGDCDLFEVALERLPEAEWAPVELAFAPVTSTRLADLPEPPPRSPEPLPVPRASLWVADWYRRADGSLAPLAEQDVEGLEVYGERLATMLAHVRELTGADRVNVVCHCMGGLVARAALQGWRDGAFGHADAAGRPAHEGVRHLVTVASPLRGNSFLGLLRLARALRLPLYRRGFTRQSDDMTRGSDLLRRLNQGERWRERLPGTPAACLKPGGRDAPPFHHSLTGDGYLVMDGAVPTAATRAAGLPGSPVLLAADEHAVLYEGADGRCATRPGRRLVHVPEDVWGRAVTEDKSRALTDWILTHLEPDLPVVFVHGSYLFRGSADLSWRVLLHRLTGDVPGWPARYVRVDTGPDGSADSWLLDANYDPKSNTLTSSKRNWESQLLNPKAPPVSSAGSSNCR